MQNETMIAETLTQELNSILENFNFGFITYREYVGQSLDEIVKAQKQITQLINETKLFN